MKKRTKFSLIAGLGLVTWLYYERDGLRQLGRIAKQQQAEILTAVENLGDKVQAVNQVLQELGTTLPESLDVLAKLITDLEEYQTTITPTLEHLSQRDKKWRFFEKIRIFRA